MELKSLYKPKQYFEDPQLEIHLRRKGFVKKKTEGLRDQFGMNQASDNVYYIYQLKGKVLVFYSDLPRKGGEFSGVLFLPLIKSIESDIKGRPGHLEIKGASGISLNLKIEDKKERDELIKNLRYFIGYYKNDTSFDGDVYTSIINPELHLKLQSESELTDWDFLPNKLDYSCFIRDKGLMSIIENNILEIVKNRIAISPVIEEIKDKKGSIINDLSTGDKTQANLLSQRRTIVGGQQAGSVCVLMMCQRPINIVDEEFNVDDDAIMEKENLPEWLEFNKILYFNYAGPGDTTPSFRSFELL